MIRHDVLMTRAVKSGNQLGGEILDMHMLERGTGISLWRQIAMQLRADIASGHFGQADKLPNEIDLANRFGVNRHTVRRAIAELTAEGLVSARRGEGTFVTPAILDYPIARRMRFHEIAASQARRAHGGFISADSEPADRTTSEKLACGEGTELIRLETLYETDGVPTSMSTAWFVAAKVPNLVEDFKASGSLTAALSNAGYGDYRRDGTRISARSATDVEIERLMIADNPVVLVNEYVNVDGSGHPLQFARTRFAASRVQLTVGSE